MESLFDIVIPLGPNDYNKIDTMLSYTIKNVIGYRKIFVVAKEKKFTSDVEFINEDIFPFNFDTIKIYLGNNDRIGWYFQQLIKLYAGFHIPNILNNYLVIDSDTFFLRPTTFFKNNLPMYNFGSEYHVPYFNHMKELHPNLMKTSSKSGICHHMMFQKDKVVQLFNIVEDLHKNNFYNIFLNSISNEHILGSGASEYEIYFNFLLRYFEKDIIIRELKWINHSGIPINEDYDYVSCHWYL
jgi:hypothetical protein